MPRNLENYRLWKEKNKERLKEYRNNWTEKHKEELKDYYSKWYDEHPDYRKNWYKTNKDYETNYVNNDLNSKGITKAYIRDLSARYLKKYGKKIKGYNIHHCCTYNEPYKFIYCSSQMHTLIHRYLRQHNIDADSDHYELIKHLLDDTVIKYNID